MKPLRTTTIKVSALWRATKAQWTHDDVTIIRDAPVIWWLKRWGGGGGGGGGGCEIDIKRVYFRNDSQLCVHFESRWLNAMVRSCVNTCRDVIGNVETFWSKSYHSRNKNLFDSVSERPWKLPSYLFLIFCRFQVYNDDITIERAWSIYSHGSETRSLGEISTYRLFQNLNFRIWISRYFLWCVTHQPGIYEMKHENAQRWIRMGSSMVNFRCMPTLNKTKKSGRSPKIVALCLLLTLVAIRYDFFNCMIQSKWNKIIHESTIIMLIQP